MINKHYGIIMLAKIKEYILIMVQLHSKAPTEEIKKNWRIFALGGLPVVLLTLFCGEKIFIYFQLPKIDFLNNYGGFIFFGFVVVYVIVFFNYKKCREITDKNYQKHGKT